MTRRDTALLLITALAWGSSFMFIKIALNDVPPLLIMSLRCLIGGSLLWIVAARSRPMRTAISEGFRQRRWSLLAVGLLTATPLWLIARGEQHISSGLAGVINATVPLWAALLALRWDPEHKTTPLRLVGVIIGFGGILMLLFTRGGAGNSSELSGILMVATAAAMYAVGAVIVRQRLLHIPTIEIAAWAVSLGGLLSLPVGMFTVGDLTLHAASIASVIVLGVAGTFLGFLCYYELLAHVGAARAAMVTYLVPGFALM